MNEEIFNSTVQNLKFNIGNDIAYTYSSFVPEGTENKLLKLKCDILPADRSLLQDPKSAGNSFLCPYDVLTDRIRQRIEDFYEDIEFSSQAYSKLSRFGERAKTFTAYFQKNLKASMQNTQRTLLRELDLQIMQNRTPKQITAYLNTILDRRMRNLRQLLQSSAGQMEQFMILWEYQDCGFNRYRYVAVGTTCEGCTALDGQIFSIDEAEPGVNFGTLHPHCDCKTEILDANGNAVYTISSVKKEEKQKKSDDSLKQYNFLSSYLGKSLRQLLMGNFTEDVTLLGTALQVIAGLLDLDLPLDLRDLAYDLTHWENTPKHIAQTAMDFLALLPVIGSLKYSDEVSAVLKTAAKHGDEAADVAKAATKHADEAADAAKAATKHADDAADAAKAATKEGKALQNAADALIDGKVAGKIPLEEYEAIRKRSVKNAASDTLTLGKYAADETSYTVRAGKTSYFDLGDEWSPIKGKYNLNEDEMFEIFNKPVLEDALNEGKTIRFSHNPTLNEGFLLREWEYIKKAADLSDENLVFEGGFWYVRK